MKYYTFFILFTVLINSGCRVFDKPELIPSFVEIDEFTLVTTSAQGTNDHKIKDVWVLVDSKFVGAYELPARIPIIANGEHRVELLPGIYKNGVQDERVIYPFYTHFDSTFVLEPDKTVKVAPVITYVDDINVFWIEAFEDPSIKWNLFTTNSDTTMIRVTNPNDYDIYEGSGSGLIKMSSNNIYCEMRTDEPDFYDLPRTFSEDAYIEMNYKSNYKFVMGLLHNESGLSSYDKQALITFNPTTDENGVPQWNKTYLYIPDVTNFFQSATKFDFYISVLNNDATDGIEVYFDNFKVIY